MQLQIPTLSGLKQSDDSVATPNSFAARDGNGDLVMNKALTTGLRSSGHFYLSGLVVKAASFAVDDAKTAYLCNAAAGAITVTLPAAAACAGQVVIVKKTDAVNNVTIDGNAAETIDGAATKVLTAQYEKAWLLSDGTSWHVIG